MNMYNYIGKQLSKDILSAVINALKNSKHYPSLTITILSSEDFKRTGAHLRVNNDYLRVVRRFASTDDFNISPTDLMENRYCKMCLINANGVFVVPAIDIIHAVDNNELNMFAPAANKGLFVHIPVEWLTSNNY